MSRDAAPLITWMPYNNTAPESNVIVEIASGQWDVYIDSLRIASTEADAETAPVTGIAKAMTVSKIPTVVGEAREAEGLCNMPKAELSKWRLGRVLGE